MPEWNSSGWAEIHWFALDEWKKMRITSRLSFSTSGVIQMKKRWS
jgi:hypothetical protein